MAARRRGSEARARRKIRRRNHRGTKPTVRRGQVQVRLLEPMASPRVLPRQTITTVQAPRTVAALTSRLNGATAANRIMAIAVPRSRAPTIRHLRTLTQRHPGRTPRQAAAIPRLPAPIPRQAIAAVVEAILLRLARTRRQAVAEEATMAVAAAVPTVVEVVVAVTAAAVVVAAPTVEEGARTVEAPLTDIIDFFANENARPDIAAGLLFFCDTQWA